MRQSFGYLIYETAGSDEPIAGADTFETAEKVAKMLGGVVKENVLFRMVGDCYATMQGIFVDGESLGAILIRQEQVSPAKNATRELGWVEITIKQVSEPQESEMNK